MTDPVIGWWAAFPESGEVYGPYPTTLGVMVHVTTTFDLDTVTRCTILRGTEAEAIEAAR